MFTDLSSFLSTGVTTLVANTNKLHVLFATYNTVKGYKDGNVQTDKEGLTLQVQNGNLEYTIMVPLGLMSGHPSVRNAAHDLMHEMGREAQSTVESALKIDPAEDASFIAVVYAGLSAFDEAVAMARKIKKDRPASKIIITTCTCNRQRKERVLFPMLDTKQVDVVVIDRECGGDYMMRKILETIIYTWPVKVMA